MYVRPVQLSSAIRSAPKTAHTLSTEDIQALRALPYERYLLSKWWRYRRNLALREAGYHCRRCASKRELQVHHTNYKRLGAELSEDLEVLCRGCHLGEHAAEVQSYVGLYTRVLSEVISAHEYEYVSDILEAAKRRCAVLKIQVRPNEFHAAVSRVLPRVPLQVPADKAELYHVGEQHQPLSRAEAAAALSRLKAAGLMKHMPEVRPLKLYEMECRRALGIVAQAIIEQTAVCDAVEQPDELAARGLVVPVPAQGREAALLAAGKRAR